MFDNQLIWRELPNQAVLLRWQAPLTRFEAEAFLWALERAGRCAAQRILLDLSAASFVDSAGIALLLTAVERTRQRGRTLSVVHLNPQARKVFRLYGLDRIPQVFNAAAVPPPA